MYGVNKIYSEKKKHFMSSWIGYRAYRTGNVPPVVF